MPYNLYVCPKDGKGYLEHIAFRNYLRKHPEVMEAYAELKMKLAEQHKNDIEGDANAKGDFVKSILEKTKLEKTKISE